MLSPLMLSQDETLIRVFDDTGIFFVALGWVSNSVLAILSKFMPRSGDATGPKPNNNALSVQALLG